MGGTNQGTPAPTTGASGACDKCVCDTGGKEVEDLVVDAPFVYQPIFTHANPVDVPYEKLEHLTKGVVMSETTIGETQRQIVSVEPWVLTQLAEHCITQISHFLRPGHLAQLSKILTDPEASGNDQFAARNLLDNAVIASNKVLPGCQDTGTAIAMGKRGQNVFTDGDDESHLSRGIYDAYTKRNFATHRLLHSPCLQRRIPRQICQLRLIYLPPRVALMNSCSWPKEEDLQIRLTSFNRPKRF